MQLTEEANGQTEKKKVTRRKYRVRETERGGKSNLENCLENRSLKKNERLSDCAKICCQGREPKKLAMLDGEKEIEIERDKAQKKGFSLLAKKYVAKFVGHGGRRGRVLVGGMWVGWKAL